MAAALYDDLSRLGREVSPVFFVPFPVQHPILGTVHRKHLQAGTVQILGGVGRQQDQPVKLPAVVRGIGCRHGSA